MREQTYRVEFNEKQQNFHLSRDRREPNTYGWFTVFESATDFEFKIFMAYIETKSVKRYSREYLTKCAVILPRFIANLLERGLTITPINDLQE